MSHSGPKNRLAKEKSPYLLQHQHNPVDWFPWGPEAFELSRSENKPIFLSIGYSTCHWCHVMERESFEDESTAELMNAKFVNVKVDREEHPDVDQIYMSVVQAMTGHGGWPMSVFLTPDLHPFYAGTYFPPTSRYGHPAFPQILQSLSQAWITEPEKLRKQGAQIIEHIDRAPSERAKRERIESRRAIDDAMQQLQTSFDATWGGFGGAPKFPRSTTLMLMMRDAIRLDDEDLKQARLGMVEQTLEMMWRGGLYDHVGGGFARYSTDERWLVPHFEKMLYDNALLAISYAEAWQHSKNEDHARVVNETLDWVLREMRHPEGGFFSAQDADSEGVEGKFYVWTHDQIVEALGKDDANFVARVYDVSELGNFEGNSILYLPKTIDQTAQLLGTTREDLIARLDPLRRRLYDLREERIHPGLDDKVLSSWNGLMIAAMARSGSQLGEERFVKAARDAAEFMERELCRDGELQRRWRDGDAALNGTLEDYAFSAWGLVELFLATSEPRWLSLASSRLEAMVERFHDSESGGFWFADEATQHLVVRMKEPYDGATPSGNSVAAWCLLWVGLLRDDDRLRALGEETIATFRPQITRSGIAHPMMLCALDLSQTAPQQVVIAVGEDVEEADRMERILRSSFAPHAALIRVEPEEREALEALLPWLKGKGSVDGKSAVWVCRDFHCELPLTSVDDLSL